MRWSKVFFLFFIFSSIASLHSDGADPMESLLDDTNFIDLSNLPEDFSDMTMPTRSITPKDVLVILVAANAPGILALDFYLRTNPLNDRQLTTLPVFLLWHTNYIEYCSLFRFYLFYNNTPMMFFTKNCPFIKSYIAVDDNNLFNEILKNELVNLENVPEVLDLFKNIKIEERRLGIMFQWFKNWNKTSLEFDLPFLYQERNFILSESEIVDLKTSNLFKNTGNSKVQEKDIRKNVVADLLGFSDLKIKLGQQVVNLPYRSVKLGFELYIPTAFALKKGLVGSNFTNTEVPDLDLTELVDLFVNDQSEEAIEIGKEFAKATANRLAAMTIQSELGNNKHVVIDGWAEGRFEISDMLSINTYANLKYTFPEHETRYFLIKKNLCSNCPATRQRLIDQGQCNDCYVTSRYQQIIDSGTDEQIECALDFLEEQVLVTLFPSALKTLVSPGFSTQFTIAPNINYEYWNLSLGFDVWFQQKERLTLLECNPADYKMNIARKPTAYQSRVFARLYKDISRPKYDLAVGLQGDYCVNSVGIGKDFTFALSCEFNF
ncbi:hypothetical protein A3F66_03650 [candidate division TM6 bacterium RIFCSPHIGHO2_12_FULL_32_22]|nr:MAG: hypothetical protein A3F66_03650 [candidate division TM6 bacterium RIFCSPHIGHO2_12_FULL_32_22]